VSRRLAAALALGLALAATSVTPGRAQRLQPPRLSFTALKVSESPGGPVYGSTLFGVSFPNADTGYAVGAYHSIFKTTDGGATWARQPNPLPTRAPKKGDAEDPAGQALTAVSFTSPDHGVAVATIGGILVTSDGGATWSIRQPPAPASVGAAFPNNIPPTSWSLTGVSLTDANNGYVVGITGLILSTADGGATWVYRGNPRYGDLQDVKFVDEFHGQIVGRVTGRADGINFTTIGTNDAGDSWQENKASTPGDAVSALNMSGVTVTSPMHAVAVGDFGRIFITFDEGKTWRNRRSGTNEALTDVAFADRRRGIAVGGINFQGDLRGVVLATNDGGESWTPFPQPDVGYFTSVTFGSQNTAYAVGCTDTVREGDGVCDAAAVRIDFPELDAAIEEPVSSGGSRLPLYLLGAAVLVAGAGLLLARRR
jgi:photosystem II stability/assembly factor-like uncharacterized protein